MLNQNLFNIKISCLEFNSLHAGYFLCFCCHFLTFFNIDFFLKKIFQKHYQSVKSLNPDQDPRSAGPDLGTNCLQRLTAEDKNLLAGNELNIDFFIFESLR